MSRFRIDGYPSCDHLFLPAVGTVFGPEEQAVLDAYQEFRAARMREIAEDLIHDRKVFDGRHAWGRSDCYAEFDLAEFVDAAVYSGGRACDQAIKALADQVEQAAAAIAARIVDAVIAYDEGRRIEEERA